MNGTFRDNHTAWAVKWGVTFRYRVNVIRCYVDDDTFREAHPKEGSWRIVLTMIEGLNWFDRKSVDCDWSIKKKEEAPQGKAEDETGVCVMDVGTLEGALSIVVVCRGVGLDLVEWYSVGISDVGVTVGDPSYFTTLVNKF